MIKRRYVRTRQLQEGMRIDQAIKDRLDRTLIARGTFLDAYMIENLIHLGVPAVYIREGEEDPEPEKPKVELKPEVKHKVEKMRREDPVKVSLKESVKKRVSEGIQYLYNNTDSSNFSDMTTNITDELMRAINDNNAIAVDINVLKTSDEYTFKHSVDVATLAMIVAKKQGMGREDIYNIGIAGLLHDMGKSKIPNEILNKPAKLDDAEFAIMKQHPLLGYAILKDKKEFPTTVPLAVLQHHEKMNGRGYPLGVTAEKITPYAKILSVVDVYDALVTERPYKKALSQRTAVEMIMSMTDDLDIVSMKTFLSSVILYAVDTTVQLSNGEDAVVVKNNPDSVLRPVVVGCTSGKVYDLATDISCANVIIL